MDELIHMFLIKVRTRLLAIRMDQRYIELSELRAWNFYQFRSGSSHLLRVSLLYSLLLRLQIIVLNSSALASQGGAQSRHSCPSSFSWLARCNRCLRSGRLTPWLKEHVDG